MVLGFAEYLDILKSKRFNEGGIPKMDDEKWNETCEKVNAFLDAHDDEILRSTLTSLMNTGNDKPNRRRTALSGMKMMLEEKEGNPFGRKVRITVELSSEAKKYLALVETNRGAEWDALEDDAPEVLKPHGRSKVKVHTRATWIEACLKVETKRFR